MDYEKRHGELVRIIGSFESLEKSKEWETLKELVFDKSHSSVERQLLNAAKEPLIEISRLYKLQGELSWTKRLSNIPAFVEIYKQELISVKEKLK